MSISWHPLVLFIHSVAINFGELDHKLTDFCGNSDKIFLPLFPGCFLGISNAGIGGDLRPFAFGPGPAFVEGRDAKFFVLAVAGLAQRPH